VICPDCNAASQVIESRPAEGGSAVRRRRECTQCGFRFTTLERLAATRLQVVKRDGRRQSFDAEKLRGALTRAAHKRDVTAAQIAAVVERVRHHATERGGSISAELIGDLCLEELARLDRGALLQFAGTLPEIRPEFASFAAAGSVRDEEDSP
jgi:transcriptional repressor NrdR